MVVLGVEGFLMSEVPMYDVSSKVNLHHVINFRPVSRDRMTPCSPQNPEDRNPHSPPSEFASGTMYFFGPTHQTSGKDFTNVGLIARELSLFLESRRTQSGGRTNPPSDPPNAPANPALTHPPRLSARPSRTRFPRWAPLQLPLALSHSRSRSRSLALSQTPSPGRAASACRDAGPAMPHPYGVPLQTPLIP